MAKLALDQPRAEAPQDGEEVRGQARRQLIAIIHDPKAPDEDRDEARAQAAEAAAQRLARRGCATAAR